MSEVLRWQIGDVRITRLQELEAPDIRFILPDANVENLAEISWLGPFLADNGHALASIHTLIVETGERRILVDTCVGNYKHRPDTKPWHMKEDPFVDDMMGDGGGGPTAGAETTP